MRAGPALVLAGGSNVVIADAGVPARSCSCARAAFERDGELLVVQAGSRGTSSSPAASRRACRASSACPGSPARPARRRSRTSAPTGRTSRRRSRGCASMTARRDARRHAGRRRVRLRLPPQRLQVPRPLDRARGRLPARGPRAPGRCATPSSRACSACRSAGARRSPRCARRCWPAPRQGHGHRPRGSRLRQRRLVLHEPDQQYVVKRAHTTMHCLESGGSASRCQGPR